MIASTCLAYLWTLQNSHLPKLIEVTPHVMKLSEIRTKFPLTDFATRHWLGHARAAGENQERLFLWTSKFFMDKPFIKFWLGFRNAIDEWPQALISNYGRVPALYFASLAGLNRSIELLLDSGAKIDAGSIIGRSALQVAAHEGHMELVMTLLDHGATAKARNMRHHPVGSGSHITALAAASWNGHIQTVQLLLKHAPDIDAGAGCTTGPSGEYNFPTALWSASFNGHLEVVQCLLVGGANVNAYDWLHGTALSAALSTAHTQVSLLLLQWDADIHTSGGDSHGNALCAAVFGGDLALVENLLQRGARISSHEEEYETALLTAVEVDRIDLVDVLLSHYTDIDRKVLDDALRRVRSTTDRRVIKTLLDHGANINHPRTHLLHMLCEQGSLQTARLLLENGADVNNQLNQDRNPLITACQNDRLDVVMLLISMGADVNHNNSEGVSALQMAFIYKCFEIAGYLLKNGAQISEAKSYHDPPLLTSCNCGNFEMVKMLCEHGANINQQSMRNQNALEAACNHGDIAIVQFLIDHGANVKMCDSNALTVASEKGYLEIAQLLLAHGADVRGGSPYKTPMQAACYGERIQVVELLLKNGAEVSVTAFGYGSTLNNACHTRNTDMVDLLLNAGLDVNAQTTAHGSALQFVCSSHLSVDLSMVRLLLKRGARVNARGGGLGTPLCEAASSGKVDVALMLLEKGADINLRDNRLGSALRAACSFRHMDLDTVHRLSESGFDLDVGSGEYGNALCAAVYNNHIELAQLLLDRGARIDTRGGQYGNPLQIAIMKGLDHIRKVLLKQGWRIVIRKRPLWRRGCVLSNRHRRIQRHETLRSINGKSWMFRDISSDHSWFSDSRSGSGRVSNMDHETYSREQRFSYSSSVHSSRSSSSDFWVGGSSGQG